MQVTRRSFVGRALKGSVLTLAYSVSGAQLLLTPHEARAQQVPLRHLDVQQRQILERLGAVILPGSVEAGLAHFIDHQLGVDPDDSLLIAKYFQVPPPYYNFYATGLKLASNEARKPIPEMEDAEVKSLVREIAQPGAMADGYPLNLFYMCLRSDAVDVVYGTPEGFARLNIPYMEHIMPPESWND